MPITIGNRKFKSFGSAVKFVMETLDLDKDKARAYVAAVDRKQNKPDEGAEKETKTDE